MMKKLLLAALVAFIPSFASAQCSGVFGSGYVCGNNGLSSAAPSAKPFASFGALIAAPKLQIYSATGLTSFTPDADTTLIYVKLIGPGGGGMGSSPRNPVVPAVYTQYGGVGIPSGFDIISYTATITNASPGIVTATASNMECNQMGYFTSTGTLPSPLAASTIYYTECTDTGPAPTANTFALSTLQQRYPAASFASIAPQTPINTTTAGSGVHTWNKFRYQAHTGQGGGIIGDQAIPGSYTGCNASGRSGYQQSLGYQGGAGQNIYGINIAPGRGGDGPLGGPPGDGGTGAINGGGGGGSGANPTTTASGGGGGGGGGGCEIWMKPIGAAIRMVCGTQGLGGVALQLSATATNASPAVFTVNAHNFPPNAALTLTGTPPTGFSLATSYYVVPATITANTFELAAAPYGAAINSTSTGGPMQVNGGSVGGTGGHGACIITQFKGFD